MAEGLKTPQERLELLENRVGTLEEDNEHLRRLLGGAATFKALTEVDMFVFEGGARPVRQTDGAVGFDAYARAVVDPLSRPTDTDLLRRSRADFIKTDGWQNRIDEELLDWVIDDPDNEDRYGISLPIGEKLMVGLGFATRMGGLLHYSVLPRSGHAAKSIIVANGPGTVDPDYRGEAGALMENNSTDEFQIFHKMRIVQCKFELAIDPLINIVERHEELGQSVRGVGGFGSTGVHGGQDRQH